MSVGNLHSTPSFLFLAAIGSCVRACSLVYRLPIWFCDAPVVFIPPYLEYRAAEGKDECDKAKFNLHKILLINADIY